MSSTDPAGAIGCRSLPAPTIAIAGGGTGGHVYPGLAVAGALGELSPQWQVLFLGGKNGIEKELVARAGFPFINVTSGALRGQGPLGKVGSALRLLRGIVEARTALRRHRVQAILATGGYVSAPVVLGGWLSGIPSLIYLPDVEPGLAVHSLSRFARRVAVTTDDSRRFLPAKKVVATGYPLRPEVLKSDRKTARAALGIAAHETVILVLGGSRGAHSINAAIANDLPSLLAKAIVLHSSGRTDEPWLREVAAALPSAIASRYHLAPYFHEQLAPAMASADLAISRAGASVMGEYPYFGLPSILIPYPYAAAHQQHNADCLVANGAALQLHDEQLPSGVLVPTISGMLSDRDRLSAMGRAARGLARPDAAKAIAEELLRLCLSA